MNAPSTRPNCAPKDWHTITPRLFAHDPEKLVQFLKQVFDAKGEYQSAVPTQLWIGDSVIMISDASARSPMSACLYVYVGDTDATYRRAIDTGARSVEAPAIMPYGDRRCMFEDAWGNAWQVATYLGDR